jgi:uncharacterized membrane protein YgdD (TMEM256/DUF423 family)
MKGRATWAIIGAVCGFTAVATGAIGEHLLTDAKPREWMDLGSEYHLAHSMTIFLTQSFRNWGAERARHAAPLFFAGILLFSGSLYTMALGGPTWLGAITPLGGVCFLAGWAVLAMAGFDLHEQARKTEPRP